MTNLECIQLQKNKTTPLTQEMIDEMKNRNSTTYTSGREKKVGERVFLGMLRDDKGYDSTVSIITFNEDEYGTLYVDDPIFADYNFNDGHFLLRLIKK